MNKINEYITYYKEEIRIIQELVKEGKWNTIKADHFIKHCEAEIKRYEKYKNQRKEK